MQNRINSQKLNTTQLRGRNSSKHNELSNGSIVNEDQLSGPLGNQAHIGSTIMQVRHADALVDTLDDALEGFPAEGEEDEVGTFKSSIYRKAEPPKQKAKDKKMSQGTLRSFGPKEGENLTSFNPTRECSPLPIQADTGKFMQFLYLSNANQRKLKEMQDRIQGQLSGFAHGSFQRESQHFSSNLSQTGAATQL